MRKQTIAKVGLLLAGTLIGLGLAEIGVRLAAPQPLGPARKETPRLGLRLNPDDSSRTVTEEFDVIVRTNSAGYHDVEHSRAKPEGTFRIVVLGDSFVEAVQVTTEENLCRLLEAELAPDRPVEVINLGVAGSGTAAEYLRLKDEGLAYAPDLVVLVFTVTNDVYNNSPDLEVKKNKPFFTLTGEGQLQRFTPPPEQPQEADDGGLLVALARRSHLLRLVLRAQAARRHLDDGAGVPIDYYVFAENGTPVWDDAWSVTEALLGASAESARAGGAGFVLVVVPDRLQLQDDLWERAVDGYPGMADLSWDRAEPNERLEAICARQQLDCLDLLPPFAQHLAAGGEPLHFAIDGHLNAEGHRRTARLLAAHLDHGALAQPGIEESGKAIEGAENTEDP